MAFDKAKQYLEERGLGDRVLEFEVSSATVELAAQAVGTEPGQIAKSLTFNKNTARIPLSSAGSGMNCKQ